MSTFALLCVDDESTVLSDLRTQLLRHFPIHRIETVESATEALEVMKELLTQGVEVPLVIADQGMPGMNGNELLLEFQTRYPETLRILLLDRSCMECGVDGFNWSVFYRCIPKPWDEIDLVLTVTEALRRYQQDRQLAQYQIALEQANRELARLNTNLNQPVPERIQQLQQSEQQLEKLFAAMDDVVLVLDFQGTILKVLTPHSKDLYWSSEELIGKTPEDLFPEDEIALPRNCIRQALLTGQMQECDYHLSYGATGQWFHGKCSLLSEETVLWVARNISDRKQAEVALQDKEERLRIALAAAHMGTWDWNIATHQIVWSDSLERLMGFQPGSFDGRFETLINLIHPDDLQRVSEAITRSVEQGEEYNVEFRFVKPDGSVRWAMSKGTVLRDQSGQAIRMAGVDADITDRKLAEIALKKALQELTHHIEASPLATIRWNREFRIEFWSNQAEQMFGWKAEEVIGKTMHDWRFIFEEDLEHVNQLAGQLVKGTSVACQNRNYHKDGTVLHCEWFNSILLDEQGNLVSILSLAQDVSDRKAAEAALRQDEARFQTLVKNMPGMIYRYFPSNDGIGRFTYVSSGSRELMELEPECIIQDANRVWSLIHPEDFPSLQASVAAAVESCADWRWEGRLTTPSGQLKWIQGSSRPEYTSDGIVWDGLLLDISDRKMVELALQQNEAKFHEFAAASPAIIYTVFPASERGRHFEYLSPAAAEIHEIPVADLLQDGGIIERQIHPEDQAGYYQKAAQCLENAQPFQSEFRIIPPSGKVKWLSCYSRPQKRPTGEMVWHGIVLDVTDRKQAEIALQQSETRYRILAETSPVGIFRFDTPLNCVYVNDRWSEMTGRPRESALGNGWVDALHPEDRTHSLPQWAECYTQAEPTKFVLTPCEARHLLPDGSVNWCYVQVAQEIDAAGKVIGYVGTLTNITEQKQTEEALRQEVARRVTLFNSSIDGIVIVDEAGNVLEANASFTRMLGYSQEEITTLNIKDFDAGWTAEELELKVVNQDFCINSFQTRHRRKDGSIYNVEISANSVDWHGQKVQLCICRDITDRKRLEAELRQREAFLESIFNGVEVAINVVDVEAENIFRFIDCNPTYERLSGVKLPAMQGKTLAEMAPLLGATCLNTCHILYQQCVTTGETVESEVSLAVGGKETWWITCQTPLKDATGRVYRIVGTSTPITERKQAEARVRQSQEQLELSLEFTGIGAWSWNPMTGNYSWNGKMEELLELPVGLDNMYQVWCDRIHPEEANRVHANIQRALVTRNAFTEVYRYRLQDGRMVWRWAKGQGVYTEAGALERVLGVVQDISDRKQAEVALQQQARRERAFNEVVQAIRSSLDLDTIFTISAAQIAELLHGEVSIVQYLPEQQCWRYLIVHSLSDSSSTKLNAEIPDAGVPFAEKLKNLQVVRIDETTMDDPTNHDLAQIFPGAWLLVPISINCTIWGSLTLARPNQSIPWQTEDVNLAQRVAIQLAIAIQQANLYQQLQNELTERQQTEAALRNSESRFRLVFTEAPVGIVLLTSRGEIAQANYAFCRLLGYGTPLQPGMIWDFIHPQEVERAQSLFHQLFDRQILNYELEKRLIKRNGEEIWVRLTAGLLQNPDDGAFYQCGMYENIAEQKLVQQMKDNFVSVVSHELRTPLTSIRGALRLLALAELENLTAEGQELLNIAAADSQRLIRLVNDILDLERLRSGHLPLVKNAQDVANLIMQAVDSVRSLATEALITLEISAESIQIEVDGDRIIQTLTNLLNNAIKFSPPHTRVSIAATWLCEEASTASSPSYVLISVQDQGRGIPSDKLKVIFQPFEQVDAVDSRQKGGTGLGLAICRSIVQRHGGRIWATSVVGRGSNFLFTLPITSEMSADDA